MKQTTRVLCVDDQGSFTEALAIALGAEGDITVVDTAPDVLHALEILGEAEVDVVLLDIDLPYIDGIEGTRRIKRFHPDVRVVVLTGLGGTGSYARVSAARAAAAGADGYIEKDTDVETLFRMVRGVGHDRPALRAEHIRLLRRSVRPSDAAGVFLADREREVLALLAGGVDPHAIAIQLGIAANTCRGYIRNIVRKLEARSQDDAVVIARRRGLLKGEA